MPNQIYILTHVLDLPDEEDVKLIGVYSTEEDARAAEERARQRPGFAEHAEGFNIDAYELDRDHWVEGFDPDAPPGEEVEE
jgi:homoserine kinase type II